MARLAFVLADHYEDSEFRQPWETARQLGHETSLIGRRAGQEVTGKQGRDRARIEMDARSLDTGSFDAVVIPGGYSPDKLRLDPNVVGFVRSMAEQGKPILSICHGASLLVEADVLRGKTVTSWPSVRKDVENAGAEWVDRELVRDGNLISSRKPEDLKPFCNAMLEAVA